MDSVSGWEPQLDPASGKIVTYYNYNTGEESWEQPGDYTAPVGVGGEVAWAEEGVAGSNEAAWDVQSERPATPYEALRALADAHAALAAAQAGFVFCMDLSQKMGMVVNPNGEVSKVAAGGQAEASGVRTGCRVVAVGDALVATLEALKAALAAAKAEAAMELNVRFVDPRRAALAAVGVGRAKVTLANVEAAAAAAEADAAFAKVRNAGALSAVYLCVCFPLFLCGAFN
jgi:hypothetical protein